MRRWIAVLLLLAFAGVASGGLELVHQRQHQQQQAEWLAALEAAAGGHAAHPARPLPHSPANCVICLQLNLPLLAQAAPTMAVAFGLIAFILLIRPILLVSLPLVLPMDCRGPPQR